MPNDRTIKATLLGIRVGQIIEHPRFRYGCQPADALPNDPILVGLLNSTSLPNGFNGCFDASRGNAPFEITKIEDLDESNATDQLEGLPIGYIPAAKVVHATRLDARDRSRTPLAERITFIIAGAEDPSNNVPVVDYVSRSRAELPVGA
jgi:hypothetical protein